VILNSNHDKQYYCNCDKHQYSMSRHTYDKMSATVIVQSNRDTHSITVSIVTTCIDKKYMV